MYACTEGTIMLTREVSEPAQREAVARVISCKRESHHSAAAGNELHGPSCGLRVAHVNPIPYVGTYTNTSVGLSQIVETGFPEVRDHACAQWSNFMMTYRGFPQPNGIIEDPKAFLIPTCPSRFARIARSLPRIRRTSAHIIRTYIPRTTHVYKLHA